MGHEEIQETVRVDKDHRVVLTLPNLAEGTQVQVTVKKIAAAKANGGRRPGSAKGLLKIENGFDDPLLLPQ